MSEPKLSGLDEEMILMSFHNAKPAAEQVTNEQARVDNLASDHVANRRSISSGEQVTAEPISQDAATIAQTAHVIINRLTEENEKLRYQLVCIQEAMTPCARFVMWALVNGSWQGCDLDGGSVQDKAVELGLIHAIPYNPEIHASSDCCEAGDEWFVPTEIMERALSRLSDEIQEKS